MHSSLQSPRASARPPNVRGQCVNSRTAAPWRRLTGGGHQNHAPAGLVQPDQDKAPAWGATYQRRRSEGGSTTAQGTVAACTDGRKATLVAQPLANW